MNRTAALTILTALALPAAAQTTTVSNYDDLAEAFYGQTFSYNGVTYTDVNNVDGVFPDGSTFEAGGGIEGLGNTIMVENATFLYNDFPSWGSANNALTFGSSYVVGDNLSLGALSTVTMLLDEVSDFASVEMAFYENGPWGGIVYHLEAFMGGSLVAADSFTIADGGGRDNIAFNSLSVEGAAFESLRLYATFGDQYSGPRVLLDNLTIRTVPAPGTLAMLALVGLAGRRRRG